MSIILYFVFCFLLQFLVCLVMHFLCLFICCICISFQQRWSIKYYTIPHLSDAVAGGSFDWAKGVAGIKYSYGLELRDLGHYGFLLPRHYIVPSGEEVWEAIQAVAFHVLDHDLNEVRLV